MTFRIAFAAALLFCQSPLLAKTNASVRLIQDLESSDPTARAQAQSELRAYRFKDVVKLVADFGDGANPDVRILMTQVLGELGGPESARHLQKLFFKEKVDRVRRAILVQLTGLIPSDAEAFNFYGRVIDWDRNPELRLLAASQIALLGRYQEFHAEVVSLLERLERKDPDATNRAFAVLLAASITDNKEDGLRKVEAALQNPEPIVRRKAVELLTESGDPFLIDRMRPLSESDPDPQVRQLVQKALFLLDQ